MATSPCHPSGAGRPRLEVADIFRTHGDAYRATHPLTPEQARVMRAIETCRTAALGGHLDVCDQCAFERPAYNSCRNRHCPKCQSLAQARWLDRQMGRILPTHYFHLVFTLPEELRGLALYNRQLIFNLLFEAASRTLLELGSDQTRLGALLGFTAVLHTWTRDLRFHPHLHCIVTGGGLRIETGEWVSRNGGRYLFPVAVLSALFRGKFMAGLARARKRNDLVFAGRCAALADDGVWATFKDKLYRKGWVVYAKRPFGGAEGVYKYLGRYTHRVGLSNFRLQAIDDSGVTFSTKDGKSVTLTHEEFIRRFLLHVLPTSFVKIRHYGLFASPNLGSKLVCAKEALDKSATPGRRNPDVDTGAAQEREWPELLRDLTGVDLLRCPQCKTGTMVRRPLNTPPALSRSP
ncbi:MAG: IS91 family transposase [Thermoleophilia bacterium]|nr:IS91 family transposase [Thermoleophilia bacterium]